MTVNVNKPTHTPGQVPGEEYGKKKEPGRKEFNQRNYRTARDSTSVNPDFETPIDPRMPLMPPA